MADFGMLIGGIGQSGFIGRAIVGLDLDTKKYQAEMKAAEAQTAAGTQSLGQKFGALGGFAKAAFLGVGVAAVAGIGVAIKAGSDLNEQINKSRVVFGDASQSVIDFSETAASSLGLAQSEALTAAGNFGSMFDAAELSSQAAAEMSVKMVELGADLGSFNNIPVAEALEKIRAGLAGEAEPLRVLGVFLNEARVETEAYTSGIAKQGEELTDAQKIQARYNIILKDSTNAQGDFGRTVGESLPNQMKVLKAELTDVAANLGTVLLPVVLEVVQAFKLVVPLLKLAADNLDILAIALGAFAAFKFLPALLNGIAVATVRMSAAAGASLTTQGAISTVFTTLSRVAGPLAIGLGSVAFAMNESAKAAAAEKAEVDRLIESFKQGKISADAFTDAVEKARHGGAGPGRPGLPGFGQATSTAINETRAAADAAAQSLARAAMQESIVSERARELAHTHEVAGKTIRNFANMTDEEFSEWRKDTVESFRAVIFDLGDLRKGFGTTEIHIVRAFDAMRERGERFDKAMREISSKSRDWIPDEFIEFLSNLGPAHIVAFAKKNEDQQRKMVSDWRETSHGFKETIGRSFLDLDGALTKLDNKKTNHTVRIKYEYVGFDPSKPGMAGSKQAS